MLSPQCIPSSNLMGKRELFFWQLTETTVYNSCFSTANSGRAETMPVFFFFFSLLEPLDQDSVSKKHAKWIDEWVKGKLKSHVSFQTALGPLDNIFAQSSNHRSFWKSPHHSVESPHCSSFYTLFFIAVFLVTVFFNWGRCASLTLKDTYTLCIGPISSSTCYKVHGKSARNMFWIQWQTLSNGLLCWDISKPFLYWMHSCVTEPKANRECSGRWVGCRCWQSHLNSGPFLPALETGPCTRATTTMTIDWSQRADCGTTWHHVHGRILQTGKRILTLLLTRSNYGPDIAMPARETSRTWLFLRPETRQKIEARWRAKECQAHSLPGMPQS